ncbi:hypothetical protein Tco_0302773 [Tanacetum coccineum]
MSDSEHSTVTYTSVSEDDLYMGSPGVEVPVFEVPPSPDYIPGPEGPPSPDYVPGPEEPEQAPPSPIYVPFVPEPVYPEFLPGDDEVFPAEEHLHACGLDSTHRSSSHRVLIRGRRVRAAATARQVGPTTARADLYGFADILEAAPGRRMSRELGYGIRDTWDDLVGAIQEIASTTLEGDDARYERALLRARVNRLDSDRPFHRRTALLMDEEARLSRAAWAQSMDACDQKLLKADHSETETLYGDTKNSEDLKTQMNDASETVGPAKDPAETEPTKEA